MKIHIDRDNKELELEFKGKAGALLERLKINNETVVITRNGEIITEDDNVSGNDKIKIISVVSGG